MTRAGMVWRSLRFHLRSHLGVILGAALGSAALVGALGVGDSVRGSLRARAEARLGGIGVALDSGDRLFTTGLLARWAAGDAAPVGVLRVRGTAASQDGSARAHGVQVLGITPEFRRLAVPGAVPASMPGAGGVWLNEALAQQLAAKTGQTVIVRFAKPTALSPDAVLSPRSESVAALRLTVEAIVGTEALGELSLVSGQRPALNAFLDLSALSRAAGVTQRVNQALVSRGTEVATGSGATRKDALEEATRVLTSEWTLEDAQIEVRLLGEEGGERTREIEVSSPRIFLDPPVSAAAVATSGSARPILTYLANAMRAGDTLVPYSMVTAAGVPWTPPDLGRDGIVLNAWTAKELGVDVGAEIEMTWFDPEAGARLVERSRRFKVHSIVPMTGIHADRTLMPEFPGLSKAESTSDWDAGFPLVHRIRDQDEQYWKDHRGTPKAFVSLEAGREMWANRFGDATAVRYPVPAGTHAAQVDGAMADVRHGIRSRLAPEQVGLAFRGVRDEALKAAVSGQDFGGLFLGFSFFIVLAALILMGLLYRFSVEQRLSEVGTLVAIGFTRRSISRLWLAEGMGLALLGTVPGVIAGLWYARALIAGLTTVWRDAVGGVALNYHVTPSSVVIGWGASLAVAGVTLALTLRGQFARAPRELLAGETAPPRSGRAWRVGGLGWVLLAGAAVLVGVALSKGDGGQAGVFFGAGALALLGGLSVFSGWMARHEVRDATRPTGGGVDGPMFTRGQLAVRGVTRRRSRSVSTVALLASGAFLVLAIGAFQMDAARDGTRRDSGTGGFALLGETSLPVTVDLNSAAGLETFGLSTNDLPGVHVVAARVREGDDASCLNLDRAQRPRVVGVPVAGMQERKAFRFVQAMRGRSVDEGWGLLSSGEVTGSEGVLEVPAVGDAASIQWALGRRVGDAVDISDERGRRVRLRLVGAVAPSVLQGSLFIDEAAFSRLYPGETGFRFFFVDAPSNDVERDRVSAAMTRALEDVGLVMVPAVRRLNEFNAVQNTYLGTFQVLGGLGLLLGSAGLGVVVLRNVLGRRAELGLLTAIGFGRSTLSHLILAEHAALLTIGLLIGVVSAALAVLPELMSGARSLPVASLAGTVFGVAVFGLATAWAATRAAMKGRLTAALRGE